MRPRHASSVTARISTRNGLMKPSQAFAAAALKPSQAFAAASLEKSARLPPVPPEPRVPSELTVLLTWLPERIWPPGVARLRGRPR